MNGVTHTQDHSKNESDLNMSNYNNHSHANAIHPLYPQFPQVSIIPPDPHVAMYHGFQYYGYYPQFMGALNQVERNAEEAKNRDKKSGH